MILYTNLRSRSFSGSLSSEFRSRSESGSRSGFRPGFRSSGSGLWNQPESRSWLTSSGKNQTGSWAWSRSDYNSEYAAEMELINRTPRSELPLLIGTVPQAEDYLERVLRLSKGYNKIG